MARIALLVVDPFADWEPALLAAGARTDLRDEVRWLSPGGRPVHSMGGLTVHPDGAAEGLDPARADALVVIGSPAWQSPTHPDLSAVIRRAAAAGLVVAGICGATLALARAGLLDDRAHTSNALEYLKEFAPAYRGAANYRDQARAVSDRRVVTAPAVAPVTFAAEVLRLLHPDAEGELEKFCEEFAREHAR